MDPEIALLLLHAAYLDPKEAAAKAQNLWLTNPHRNKGEQEVLHHILHTWWACCEDPIAMLQWLTQVVNEEESGMRWLAGLCCAIYRTMPEALKDWPREQESEILRTLEGWAAGGPALPATWLAITRDIYDLAGIDLNRASTLHFLVCAGFTTAELDQARYYSADDNPRPTSAFRGYPGAMTASVCSYVGDLRDPPASTVLEWFETKVRHGIKLSDLIRKYLLEHPKSGLLPEDA